MTKSTYRALGLLASPTMIHSDKWINQHTIRACDFIYDTYEHSGGRFWQMSFLANWFCCRPEAQTVMAPRCSLQMDGKSWAKRLSTHFLHDGGRNNVGLAWLWGNKDARRFALLRHKIGLELHLNNPCIIAPALFNIQVMYAFFNFSLFVFF